MKESFLVMVGMVAGMGLYATLENVKINKKALKKEMNTIIDDAANMFN